MKPSQASSLLELLINRIDVTEVPFSDRGSRLLVYRVPERSRLLIKLAERLTGLQPGLDTYRRRKPFIHDLALVDAQGQELSFEKVVTAPHALRFRTSLGDFRLVFQAEHILSFGLPDGATAGLRFVVSPQFWEQTENGGSFKAVRNLAYASDGRCVRNEITPEGGGYVVEFVIEAGQDSAITLTIADSPDLAQSVRPFSTSYNVAEGRWRNWFDRVPSVAERYRQTYAYAWWIMANNLISPQGRVTYEAMTPSKMNYVGLWLWDSALHALAYRHVDPELARNQIRAMIAHQLSDGMLPDAVYDEGIVAEIDHPIRAEVTKPPILAWAALKLHETDPNLDFLREIYVPLVRWNAWWFSMNDDDVDGLAQYNHPYSSGLDDSPLWDYGMPVESPDLNTYLCVQMGSLAMIAEALGMDVEGAMWRRRSAAIVRRMIECFWDDRVGLFRALHEEEPIPVVTPFNLYPLWTGQLPREISDRLIDHLTDPAAFWDDYIIPTVSRSDPHYDPETMWRGPVWVNINYFFIEALHQVGRDDLARRLRDRTLQLVMHHPSIYEYYNSKTGERPAEAADIFGWTAAAFIDLAIQASREEGLA
ncbi:MAG: trehalase family glycosidase [Anaerolineae bacterium]|jgi:glycogen debranching enzyme